MRRNPYNPEILGAFLMSAIVLPIEAWRRWGDLLSPAALDDALIFVGAMVIATQLARRKAAAPMWWLFVCGGAWFMFCLSVWGSIYGFDQGDPSGVSVPLVIAFKLVGLTLISAASWRAIGRAQFADPYSDGNDIVRATQLKGDDKGRGLRS